MPVGDVWGNSWGDSWNSYWKTATTPAVAPPKERGGGRKSRKGLKPGPKGRRLKRYLFDDDMEVSVDLDTPQEKPKKVVKVRYSRTGLTPVLVGTLREAAFDAVAKAAKDEGLEEVTFDLAKVIGLTNDEIRAELVAELSRQAAEEEFLLLMVA